MKLTEQEDGMAVSGDAAIKQEIPKRFHGSEISVGNVVPDASKALRKAAYSGGKDSRVAKGDPVGCGNLGGIGFCGAEAYFPNCVIKVGPDGTPEMIITSPGGTCPSYPAQQVLPKPDPRPRQ
jgi:hypothetical protein